MTATDDVRRLLRQAGMQPIDGELSIRAAVLRLLEKPVRGWVGIYVDEAGLRLEIHGNGLRYRLVTVDITQPASSPVPCAHGRTHGRVTTDWVALPAATVALESECSECVAGAIEDALARAQRVAPSAARFVVSNSRARAVVALRAALGFSADRTVQGAALARFRTLMEASSRGPMARFNTHLPSTGRRFTPTLQPHEAKWRGWPPAATCRAVEFAILTLVDDAGSVTWREAMRAGDAAACPSHGQPHVSDLLDDRELFCRTEERRIRLTRSGRDRLDDLYASRKALDPSSQQAVPALRAWQHEALTAWAEHGRRGVIEAVTGTGKSRVGVEAVREALSDGLVAVVCVPTLDLIDQWERALRDAGVLGIGRLGGGQADNFVNSAVLVGTVQTLRNAQAVLDRVHGGALLVADECHRYGAPSFQEALDERYTRRLGLTATFERADSALADLEAFFEGEPVFRIGYERAVRDEVVCHYLVATIGVEFTDVERDRYDEADEACRDARSRLIGMGLPEEPFGEFMAAVSVCVKDDPGPLGDQASRYLKAFSDRAEVLADAHGKTAVVTAVTQAVRESRGTLFFTRRVTTAEAVARRLSSQGVQIRAIHGGSPPAERRDALSQLRRGKLHAVAAPQILDEGIDVPAAEIAVIVATTKSRRQMIQRMGRVMRLKTDGRRAKFVLIYVRDTSEDPVTGDAHEAFFDMITATADEVRHFHGSEVARLNSYLLERSGRVGSL